MLWPWERTAIIKARSHRSSTINKTHFGNQTGARCEWGTRCPSSTQYEMADANAIDEKGGAAAPPSFPSGKRSLSAVLG